MPTSKGKHLTYEDRCDIVFGLKEQASLRSIGSRIGVSASTISREIIRNRSDKGYRASGVIAANHCISRRACQIRSVCGSTSCIKSCSNCRQIACNTRCTQYVEQQCVRTLRAPHCCNGCRSYQTCMQHRYTYHAQDAQRSADSRLKSSRAGINATPAAIETMVALIKELSAKNQSLAHIWHTHGDALPCSARSFYRYQAHGYIAMTNLEFPRKSRYKVRKPAQPRLLFSSFNKRSYADYLQLDEQRRLQVVQMDCIEGRRCDTQVLLTLHLVRFNFQIAVLLEEKTQEQVAGALDWIESLCEGRFRELFGLLLTDRGSEFLDYTGIETGRTHAKRCEVYYCDPMQSSQKGSCEKNHEEFRKIVPKKRSNFDVLTPWQVAVMNSHINSYTRKSLGGASPLALASQVLPKSLLEGLGICFINPDDVNLTPALLEH